MTESQVAPYGSWKSPITSDLIASATIRIGQIMLDGEDIYWTEMRPAEGGRYVVVRRTPDGRTTDVTPSPFNARTRVHEYGGGSFVVADGTVYFSNFADQRLYRQDPGAEPRPITPEVDLRYADGVVDHRGAGSSAYAKTTPTPTVNRSMRSWVLISRATRATMAARCSCPGTTFTRRHASAPMGLAWRGSPGTIRICRGMAPNCGSAS